MKGLDIYWYQLLLWCNKNYLCFDPPWMIWNVLLAGIGVSCGYLLWKSTNKIATSIFGFLWFIFVPNTIYIATDIKHLFIRLPFVLSLWEKIAYIALYALFIPIGFITYWLSMYYFKKAFQRHIASFLQPFTFLHSVIVLNCIFGLGVVLGRVQRTNSWEVFTNPLKVLTEIFGLFTSFDTIVFICFFALFINAVYWIGEKYVFKKIEKVL